MHRVSAAFWRDLEQPVDPQITVLRAWPADRISLVRFRHMRQQGVRFGIDGHGFETEAAAGCEDPASNLSAIGHQDFMDVRHRALCNASIRATTVPSVTT